MYNDESTLKEDEGYLEIIENMNQALELDDPSTYQDYYDIVLAMVHENPMSLLAYVNKKWALQNSDQYKEVVQVAVKQNPMALEHINTTWINKNLEHYEKIAIEVLKALKNSQHFYPIALGAVKKYGYALRYVDENEGWVNKNPKQYYEIVIAAVTENGRALRFVKEQDSTIVKAALSENGFALEFASEDYLDIDIVISSLMKVDAKYFSANNYSEKRVEMIFDMLSYKSIKDNILLYLNILSNKNVSNNFKHDLLTFFIENFESSYKSLYKNVLECYLTLANGYTNAFSNIHSQLLANLNDHDYKELHMFFSVVDRSVLKNKQLPGLELLGNKPNDIIKNYSENNMYALDSINNLTMYKCMVPNSFLVVNYTKIKNMMEPMLKNNMPHYAESMICILRYFTMEDLLRLDEGLLEDFQEKSEHPKFKLRESRLEVTYLNIAIFDLQFTQDIYISNGIQALVDAIKSKNGVLSYKYDTSNAVYNPSKITGNISHKIKVIE